MQNGHARVMSEAREETERGIALLVDDFADAARSVERDEQRNVVSACGEIGDRDTLPVVTNGKVRLRQTCDAQPVRVRDVSRNSDQIGANANNIIAGCLAVLRASRD